MREQFIVGEASTENMGGKAYTSKPTGHTRYIEPLNRQ
jgi:hypothetical protein